jgi:hypothetical protein
VTTSPGCLWCGRPFPVRRGGSRQRFCCAGHRTMFWGAARKWAERAVTVGILTVADIKNGAPAACTLRPSGMSPLAVFASPQTCFAPVALPERSGEAEGHALLWDVAAEMSRATGWPPERNWLRLMDAFWSGDLAPDGLTYFYPGSATGREFFVYARMVLAGMLLGHAALDTGAASIDDLRHWRVADYRNQPTPFGDYFEHDHEGRVGLAVQRRELDRWQQKENPSLVSGRHSEA